MLLNATFLVESLLAAPAPKMDAAGLVEADQQRFNAMVHRDIPALDRALASELVYVHSNSGRQDKKGHLGDTANGTAVYSQIDVKEQQPSVYGKVGLIQGIATFTAGKVPAPPFTLRYTDVYVWRDARWQMVSWSCMRIPQQPEVPPPPRP